MKSASLKPPVHPQTCSPQLELVCTVHSFASLRAAIDNGADRVELVFRPDQSTNHTARTDFSVLKKGIEYAHARRRKVVLDLQSPMQPATWSGTRDLIAEAARSGIDAFAFSDPSVMLYCIGTCVHLPLHYAVPQDRLDVGQIRDLHKRFGINHVILPPVSSLALIKELRDLPQLDVAVQVYGKASAVIVPRKIGQRPQRNASSFPAEETGPVKLSEHPIDVDARPTQPDQCAAIESASNDSNYAAELAHDASTLALIPKLTKMGVRAIHIESGLHDAAKLARVTRVWHEAIEAYHSNAGHYDVKPAWLELLTRLSRTTHTR